MPRVYISSTYRDLVQEREAAAEAVRLLECQSIAMEDYVACDERPLEKCLEDVRSSEIYIGVLGWRYGYRPPNQDKSITELEYLAAKSAGIPCLLFLVDDSLKGTLPAASTDDGPDGDAVQSLRDGLKRDHTVSFFKDARELKTKVAAALGLALRKEGGVKDIRVPELLPYMADRSQQREQLADALAAHRREGARRPLAVFVHGDEREAHSAFIERLQRVTLPELLHLEAAEAPVHRLDFRWSEPAGSLGDRARRLRSRLAEAVTGTRDAAVDEVAGAIAAHRCPVMIASSVFSSDWQRHEPELIGQWLRSWRDYPDLPPGQVLMLVLSFVYKDASKGGFLKRRAIRRQAEAVGEFVNGFDFHGGKVAGVALDPLRAVREVDVMSWVEDEAGRFCREARGSTRDPLVLAEKLKPWVRQLFSESDELDDSGRMPMEALATRLRSQLRKCLSEGV